MTRTFLTSSQLAQFLSVSEQLLRSLAIEHTDFPRAHCTEIGLQFYSDEIVDWLGGLRDSGQPCGPYDYDHPDHPINQ